MIDIKKLEKLAKKRACSIVFPEAGISDKIVKCGIYLQKHKIAKVFFVADESSLVLKYKVKDLNGITIVNSKSSELAVEFAKLIYEQRKSKGISENEALALARNPVYFATMMLKSGMVDSMVCGAEFSTAESLRPALQLVKCEDNVSKVYSCNLLFGYNSFFGGKKQLLLSDCGINMNPSPEDLAECARLSAKTMLEQFGEIPRVAFLSYSTNGSAGGESVLKVKKAVEILRAENVGFEFDGELQFDSAVDENVRAKKYPDCKLSSNANVLIFPNLDSANICYKALERFGGLKNIGPITQGFLKPVNDLSRGATTEDIINVSIVTLLQVKNIKGEK